MRAHARTALPCWAETRVRPHCTSRATTEYIAHALRWLPALLSCARGKPHTPLHLAVLHVFAPRVCFCCIIGHGRSRLNASRIFAPPTVARARSLSPRNFVAPPTSPARACESFNSDGLFSHCIHARPARKVSEGPEARSRLGACRTPTPFAASLSATESLT